MYIIPFAWQEITKGQFFFYEDNTAKKSTILLRVFQSKNFFRNQKSTLTAHTRVTP